MHFRYKYQYAIVSFQYICIVLYCDIAYVYRERNGERESERGIHTKTFIGTRVNWQHSIPLEILRNVIYTEKNFLAYPNKNNELVTSYAHRNSSKIM